MDRIYLTPENHRLLQNLLGKASRDGRNRAAVQSLESELNRAQLVSEQDLPPDVVTLRSVVRVEDVGEREEMTLKVVLPGEADAAEGRVSVLAPLATAILGYRAGDTVRWLMPEGERELKVLEVIEQPEAQRSSLPTSPAAH